MKFALVIYPSFFRRAEFGAKWTVISMALNMYSLNMFPEPSLIFGCPQTVSALPDISQLLHFLGNFCLQIYAFKREIIFQHPLWNLLLCWCQAFFEEQNLEQKGQL